MTEWLTYWLADWLTDSLNDWLTDELLTDCLMDWRIDGWLTDWPMTDWLSDEWLSVCLSETHRQTDYWLPCRLIDWLTLINSLWLTLFIWHDVSESSAKLKMFNVSYSPFLPSLGIWWNGCGWHGWEHQTSAYQRHYVPIYGQCKGLTGEFKTEVPGRVRNQRVVSSETFSDVRSSQDCAISFTRVGLGGRDKDIVS